MMNMVCKPRPEKQKQIIISLFWHRVLVGLSLLFGNINLIVSFSGQSIALRENERDEILKHCDLNRKDKINARCFKMSNYPSCIF